MPVRYTGTKLYKARQKDNAVAQSLQPANIAAIREIAIISTEYL
ncbi:MAG TPA: hypothetical protein VE222_09390 [Nitrospiraceae bacterium]|jgi:hypothetical protein|nr:hypothetical protein [Nitrospiraceae bacterium]